MGSCLVGNILVMWTLDCDFWGSVFLVSCQILGFLGILCDDQSPSNGSSCFLFSKVAFVVEIHELLSLCLKVIRKVLMRTFHIPDRVQAH